MQLLEKIYKNWFGKLRPQEQRLFVIFITVLFIIVLFSACIKPIYTQSAEFNREKSDIYARIKLLSGQFIDIGKIEQELEGIRKDISAKKLRADKMESELLNITQVPYLLTQLVKCSQGLAIDFESVKQEIQTDKQGFNRLYLELKFTAKYEDGVNYVRKIEEISKFVKIEQLSIVQSKISPRDLISASLKLSSLLSAAAVSQAALSKCDGTAGGLKVERNPLMPKYGPALAKKLAIKLTGITYRPETDKSTAIINATVVRPGDIIEGYRIDRIHQDSVGVNDAGEIKELKIER